MKLFSNINKDVKKLRAPMTIIGFCGGAAAALIVMAACGKLYFYSFLLLPRHAPPAAVFYFSFILTTAALCGCAALSHESARCDRGKSGIVFHLLTALFVVMWYIAFMRSGAFVFALVMLLCAAVMLFFSMGEAYERRQPLVLIIDGVCALLMIMTLWLTASAIMLN